MDLINKILLYRSISIVGLEKNTGKTETLNFIIRRVKDCGKTIAVTSIGIDGETVDAVTRTSKPEIRIYRGMIFNTAEQYFLKKRFSAEILDISDEYTILGRLVTAKALGNGRMLLSGAADTHTLKKTIENNRRFGTDITIVDGALSRLSLASPAITESMILATGAAYSSSIETLVRKTKFVCSLINLPIYDTENIRYSHNNLPLNTDNEKKGVYCLIDNELYDLGGSSALTISSISKESLEKIAIHRNIFVFGILSNKLIDFLIENNIAKGMSIVVKDFSTIFVSDDKFHLFARLGGRVEVLQKTNLIALTVNPTSPDGTVLNSDTLQKRLADEIGVEVIDVKRVESQ